MSCGVRFATPEDGAALLALTRIPMSGAVSVSFPHNGDFFAAEALKGRELKHFLWTDDATGEISGCGLRCEKTVYFNSQPVTAEYLGSLRLKPEQRWSRAIFRGYELLREYDAAHPAPVCFTTIVSDNAAAIRVLEGGRCGLPLYHPQERFRTFLFTPGAIRLDAKRSRDLSVSRGTESDRAEIFDFYKNTARHLDFFPVFGDGRFPAGLNASDFIVVRENGRIAACGAVTDPRKHRQIHVDGYAPWLRVCRPVLNAALALVRGPRMPRPGSDLDHRILAYWCVSEDGRPERFPVRKRGHVIRWKDTPKGAPRARLHALLRAAADAIPRRSILMLAAHETSRFFPSLCQITHWGYDSNLYTVSWRDRPAVDCANVPYLELLEV